MFQAIVGPFQNAFKTLANVAGRHSCAATLQRTTDFIEDLKMSFGTGIAELFAYKNLLMVRFLLILLESF